MNELISQFPLKWRATFGPFFQRNDLMFRDFLACLFVSLFIYSFGIRKGKRLRCKLIYLILKKDARNFWVNESN